MKEAEKLFQKWLDSKNLTKNGYRYYDVVNWDGAEPKERFYSEIKLKEAFINGFNADRWHYPSRGEFPDKDWSKHPANISKECWIITKRGVGTIARWDNDYRMWFERPRLAVIDVIAWQYFVPPEKLYTY